uniref:Uncharacterized protein n=1 Tax=Percolomonas cosmopolitus TaxID=63605 RepID=A0A7S1KTQ3_9EUKA
MKSSKTQMKNSSGNSSSTISFSHLAFNGRESFPLSFNKSLSVCASPPKFNLNSMSLFWKCVGQGHLKFKMQKLYSPFQKILSLLFESHVCTGTPYNWNVSGSVL